ncbi:hypothetical protein B5M45_27255 [Mycobacterium simiae]|uniref:Uncharacterized protein n=1 Tax=Mycobacterium simiae TaxID=1784 RepID=A0A1X0XN27_MYCSI|nr:hypothetical protein B5M45_27255 [Mycobacterium simiae]
MVIGLGFGSGDGECLPKQALGAAGGGDIPWSRRLGVEDDVTLTCGSLAGELFDFLDGYRLVLGDLASPGVKAHGPGFPGVIPFVPGGLFTPHRAWAERWITVVGLGEVLMLHSP